MTNTISLSIKTLKLRMERHYKLAVRHQQKGAEFEKRWRDAMFPVEKQEEVAGFVPGLRIVRENRKALVQEVDFGDNQA